MIDFRYHLVSIIAVFLALAVGLVLGTAAANGIVLDNLNGQVDRLRADKQQLRASVREMQVVADGTDAFVKLAIPMLVGGRLAGQRVAVLSAPGTPPSLRSDVVSAVRAAGATVTTQVRISPDYVDPRRDSALSGLVTALERSGTSQASGNGAARAAAELAAVLVKRPGDGSQSAPDAAEVLGSFQEARMIGLDGGGSGGVATLALLLTGSGDNTKPDAAKATADILVTLASALDARSGGAVISGPLTATAGNGLLATARNAEDVRASVGTVDSADSPVGQIETVLALAAQLRGDSVAWGAGPGTSPPAFPSP